MRFLLDSFAVSIAVVLLAVSAPRSTSAHPDYDLGRTALIDPNGSAHVFRARCCDGIAFADPCWPALDDDVTRWRGDAWCRDVILDRRDEFHALAYCVEFLSPPGLMTTWRISSGSMESASSSESLRAWLFGPFWWPRAFMFAMMFGLVSTLSAFRKWVRYLRNLLAVLGVPLIFLDFLDGDVPAWLWFQGTMAGVVLAFLLAFRPILRARRLKTAHKTPAHAQ